MQYLKIAIHIDSAPKHRDSVKSGDKHIVPALIVGINHFNIKANRKKKKKKKKKGRGLFFKSTK